MDRLREGDVVRQWFGPFVCTGTVVEVKDHGCVVDLNDDATLVGYREQLRAPNGAVLTDQPRQTWIGRGHELSTERLGAL